jgi:DAACS family dicarboxylate/amino acid:cation (Na+ or H+) symporter
MPAMDDSASPAQTPPTPSRSFVAAYRRTPLYLKILIAMVLGAAVGPLVNATWAARINQPAVIVLKLLGAIAPPLILVAVIRALITANIRGRLAGKLFFLLILNTTVAILIGLFVANVIQPGRHGSIPSGNFHITTTTGDPVAQLLDNIPGSVLEPLVSNNVIGVIIIALAIGIAARRLKPEHTKSILYAADIAFELIIMILHGIIALVPLAVFCKVVDVVGTTGFGAFKALAWFILAVLLGLAMQASYYLLRVKYGSWVRPIDLIKGTRDALVMAFSTGSSTATMPVTYENLWQRVGIREESASLGALVGTNFNNDGTALYEAMSALFVSQMIGQNLGLKDQFLVVLTSIVASVGAAGIPEAGLVTMTLVFKAVNLPIGYIALLLPVDWFLDRCRTAINVMGDMNVSCLLDGKIPPSGETAA